MSIKISPLHEEELVEADQVIRMAFGTFLGMPNPLEFLGDRNFATPRWKSSNVKVLAAYDGDRVIGTNFVTRWGSFAFFGPLTVLPEYWDEGVAQRLLGATEGIYDSWNVRHTGLFTFSQSTKHLSLYQKFGYWPRYLTAVMLRTPGESKVEPTLLSRLDETRKGEVLADCKQLTHQIDKGLDLTLEMQSVLAQGTGDVVLTYSKDTLDAFAICLTGAGSEGGERLCYIKFGAARAGEAAGDRFDAMLEACDAFAFSRGVEIEAGVNLAREDAARRMLSHGYKMGFSGVAMARPHDEGFDRPDVYVINDLR